MEYVNAITLYALATCLDLFFSRSWSIYISQYSYKNIIKWLKIEIDRLSLAYNNLISQICNVIIAKYTIHGMTRCSLSKLHV